MKPSTEIPRRTIDELIALYSLEPGLKDVFVEGESDQRFIRWFIDSEVQAGRTVGVYAIDEIDVPSILVRKRNRTPGNRSEVLVLCDEIEAAIGPRFKRVTGIVDRDLSDIINDGAISSYVLKTDYGCLESYHLSPQNIDKLRALAFMRVAKPAASICESLGPILKYFFSVRAANEHLGAKLTWIDFSSFVDATKGLLTLRRDDFIRSYLQISGAYHRYAEFAKQVDRIYATLPADHRLSMNGHDAVHLLGIYLKSFYKKAEDIDRTKPHVLRHLLCCCVRSEDLREEGMFSALLSRINCTIAA